MCPIRRNSLLVYVAYPNTWDKWFSCRCCCSSKKYYLVSPCTWPVMQLFQSRPVKFWWPQKQAWRELFGLKEPCCPQSLLKSCYVFALFGIYILSLLFCILSIMSISIESLTGNKCQRKIPEEGSSAPKIRITSSQLIRKGIGWPSSLCTPSWIPFSKEEDVIFVEC